MHTFKTLCILDVLFYIAYSARYSLFVLMCRKTHITHSLTLRQPSNETDISSKEIPQVKFGNYIVG